MDQLNAAEKASKKSEKPKNNKLLKVLGIAGTLGGIFLFSYIIYSVGVDEVAEGVARIGIFGFLFIIFVYFLRICVRAYAWKLSVYEPFSIRMRDTVPAVIIGEALSSMIPLGILMSGTAKAVAIRKRIPLVAGLSSVATENLFYSLVTGLFVSFGAFLFLRNFPIPATWVYLLDATIVVILILIGLGILMVIRQWHWASWICEWFYKHGIFKRFLDSGRLQVRLFENLIYGFYRSHPKRFIPIVLLEILFHTLGVFEVWFILSSFDEVTNKITTAFYLETVSRLISIIFKLIPFVIGVDEAGAELVMTTLGLAAGIGVTVAIVRKGRILFWSALGMLLIIRRGFRLSHLKEIHGELQDGRI
ncbi:MAG: lysylphosphatidylglycerol synthase transmembrane domain-containing protein [Pyrinomonadaceae bacterium]